MRLLVDFLALVDVGALVGERGFDGVVRERMEDDAAPAASRARSASRTTAIFSAFFRRSSPLITRNFASVSPSGFTSVVPSRIAGTTRSRNLSSSSMRLFLNGFGKRPVIEIGARRVARLVAREQPDRRLQILVVAQREERDAQRRDRRSSRPRPSRAGRRVAGILEVADQHARRHVGRRGAVDHHLGAAEIDVVLRRHHRDARPFEPHLHVARRGRLDASGCREAPAATP